MGLVRGSYASIALNCWNEVLTRRYISLSWSLVLVLDRPDREVDPDPGVRSGILPRSVRMLWSVSIAAESLLEGYRLG
jgi:hypothetical protein